MMENAAVQDNPNRASLMRVSSACVIAACRRALALGVVLASVGGAQSASGKKPYTQDTYDSWHTLTGAALSPDGKWAAYTTGLVVGEGELVVRSTSGTTEYRAPRGYTGRPQMVPNADSTAQFNAAPGQFAANSQFIAFVQYAPKAEFDAARRGGRGRAAAQPRNNLGIMSLADGKVTVVPRVRSFRLSRDGGKYIAYVLEPDSGAALAPAAGGGAGRGGGGGRGGRGGGGGGGGGGGVGAESVGGGGGRRDVGATLVLRELATGTETRIEDVSAYLFDDAERVLAYTTSSSDAAKDGVWVRELTSGTTTALLSGKGSYRLLTLDRKGTQAAFVSDHADADAAKPKFSLYQAAIAGGRGQTAPAAATLVVNAGQFPGLLIAVRGRVDFTRDGSALIFALAKPQMDTIPADSLADKANYDLWHWQDPVINPVQKLQLARDRNKTYMAIYQPATKKAVRLADDSLDRVSLSENGKVALALNSLAYSIDAGWGEGGSDAWLIDATSGTRTLIGKRLHNAATLSPTGKYALYFHEGSWKSRNVASGKTVDLTAPIKDAHFFDEELADSDEPRPFGVAGWTKDDGKVLVYDKFDVWELDPTGAAPAINVTAGTGHRSNTTFRVVELARDEPALDPSQPLLLRALNGDTKESGYFRDKLGASAAPERLIMGPKNYNGLQKARKADEYLMTQQTYREFPDLWVGQSIGQVAKISNVNPQEKEYPRGDVELVTWLSDDGVKLQGILYNPEGFEPTKKYPMITYYYEKLSDGINNHVTPTWRNVINPLVYTSLGYLVFEPDIVYTIGYPGPSSAKCILPGIQSLIARGFVDSKKLGINGQSWGGYESAYIITVTNIFAAAVPNAAVVNMTSAYGGIRWESGIGRTGQYEHGQSRIGGSLWEYRDRYIDNSPLFHLDRVTTPVLWMENDADGAVPWYQGIEFFLAMRRLKKEAYMVVYNGEGHNPSKRADQKDIDKKMQEFFANKLLGAPAPEWMVRGIPYMEKGREQVKMTPAAGAGQDAKP